MKQIIKDRIEQINHGEVPQGYKKTPAGIVPVEWKLTKLRKLLEFKNGINAGKEKFGTGIKLISVMDILDTKPIYYSTIKGSIDIDSDTLENYSVTYGDILFQRSSENFEDAGKSNVYLDKNNTATYSGFVIKGKKISEYVPIYLNELLKIAPIRKQIKRYAAGSQHINVGQASLSKVELCVAGDKEQVRIAEILSKWDEAVSLQEKFVKKLELQQKALMQKLLTPKAGWKKAKLKDILVEGSKIPVSDTFQFQKITVKLNFKGLEYTDIKREMADTRPFYIRKKGEIIIGKQNFTNGSIALVTDKFNNCICSNAIMSFSVKGVFNNFFIFKYLSQPNFISKYSNLANGTGQKELSESDFLKFIVFVPDRLVQNKISEILSTFENHYNYQTQKLQKLKFQQKAMQQLLLTGIVRVN